MKKLLTPVIIMALMLLLSINCFAVSRGHAYAEDNGYYDEAIETAAPGDKVYIALAEKSDEESGHKIDSDMVPKTAKITSITTIGYIDDKKYKLVDVGELDIETEEVGDGVVWYFAVMPIKKFDVDDFPEDGCSVEGKLKVTRKNGKTFTIDLANTLTSISFAEAKSKKQLEKTAQLYRFDSGDKISLEFPNEKGHFEATAKKDIDVMASMSHTKISAITRNNSGVKTVFYCGNGAEFSNVRNPKLIIEADDDWYLYEIKSNNTLKNRSSCYDDDENAFVIETNVLGSYVVADEPLEDGDSDDDEDDDVYVYTGEDDEDDDDRRYNDSDYNHVLINPVTGAAV